MAEGQLAPRRRLLLAGLAAFALAAARPALAQSPSATSRVDPLITARARSLRDAIRAKDAKAASAFYTDDAVLMPANQPAIVGRPGIEAFFAGLIQIGASDIQATPRESVVAGDLAIESGTYTLSIPTPNGPVADRGKYVLVFRKVGDTFLVADDIFNSDLPPPRP